jgi:hypothetical protein
MKKVVCGIALLFALSLVTGCVVQSGGPYHAPEEKLDTPAALRGPWQLVDGPLMDDKDREALTQIPPWEFGESEVTSYDKHGTASKLDVTFFRIGKQLYCDSQPSPVEEEGPPNEYWTYHVMPMHLLSKVELQGDRLTFITVDASWLENQVKQGTISLPNLSLGEGLLLYTASPEQWHDFLMQYGDDPAAFPPDEALVFRRAAAASAN